MKTILGGWAGAVLAALMCVAYNTSASEPLTGRTALLVCVAGAFVGLFVASAVVIASRE